MQLQQIHSSRAGSSIQVGSYVDFLHVVAVVADPWLRSGLGTTRYDGVDFLFVVAVVANPWLGIWLGVTCFDASTHGGRMAGDDCNESEDDRG